VTGTTDDVALLENSHPSSSFPAFPVQAVVCWIRPSTLERAVLSPPILMLISQAHLPQPVKMTYEINGYPVPSSDHSGQGYGSVA
jgi:hypothetical protein